MTWSTNNNSTNAFSTTSMTNRCLTDQALKDQLNRNTAVRSSDSSGSSKGSNIIHSQRYIELKKKLDCNRQKSKVHISPSNNDQKGFESSTSSKSSGNSTLRGRVNNCSFL